MGLPDKITAQGCAVRSTERAGGADLVERLVLVRSGCHRWASEYGKNSASRVPTSAYINS